MCYIPLMRDDDDRESNVQIETGCGGHLSAFSFSHTKLPSKEKIKIKTNPTRIANKEKTTKEEKVNFMRYTMNIYQDLFLSILI